RHGRPPPAGGHRARLRLRRRGHDACVRARHARRDARLRGPAAGRAARRARRVGGVHVPARRRGPPRGAVHDPRRRAPRGLIPGTAVLEGTIRTLSEETRALVRTELPKVCEAIGAAHGCRVLADIEPGYPVTVNDEGVAREVLSIAEAALGPDNVEMISSPL